MEFDVQSRPVARSDSNYSEPDQLARRQLDSQLERFGGLRGRYAHGNWKEVRSRDPFDLRVLRFPKRVNMENWLLRLFTPGLTGHYVPTEPFLALERGRQVGAKASLVMLAEGKSRLADFIVSDDQRSAAKWAQFKTAAVAHGFTPVLRTEAEIRSQPVLLSNLDRLRSHVGLHECHSACAQALLPWIGTFLLLEGIACVGALYARVRKFQPQTAPEAIDIALVLMLRRGDIGMNLTEAAYGSDTRIQLL